jgi:hypothetical protein
MLDRRMPAVLSAEFGSRHYSPTELSPLFAPITA